MYETYLLPGKDNNLAFAQLTLEQDVRKMCGENGEDYNQIKPVEDEDWEGDGPEVIRIYPSDEDAMRLKPDKNGFRKVEYVVRLTFRDARERVTKVERFSAIELYKPKVTRP